MMQTMLHVQDRQYALAPSEDVAAIKAAAVEAAQAGAGLIEFSTLAESTVSVLVTPGIPVILEEREIPDETDDGQSDVPERTTFLDFDSFTSDD
jgi:hypothetical protein